MHLSGLFIYPVKSLRGHAVPAATLDARGFADDRRFMVVDADNRFLTQRTVPRMALIETALTTDTLTLRHAASGSVAVPRPASGVIRSVQVWRDTVDADDCGEAVATWLSDILEQTCHLVQIGEAFHRPANPEGARASDKVSFADGYPLLVLSEASLAELNNRLLATQNEPIPIDRFRPNIVVSGTTPFAEDSWQRWQIGSAIFRTINPCARCVITTTNQQTAERGPEPLRTLATYRRDATKPSNVNFGMNVVQESKTGTIRVGDPLTLLD